MQNKINNISDLIDSGELHRARHQLVRVASARSLPRWARLPLARMARRALLPKLGLRLLAPVVRPRPKSPVVPEPVEKAEYAANLLMNGAHWEARRLLGEVDPKDCPDQLLFLAYAHIFHWEYGASRELLERYLQVEGLSERQRLVGKINLLAAMVHEQWRPHIAPLSAELLATAASPRFRGNVLELTAQDAIFHGEWDRAEGFLSEARRLLRRTGGLDEFFVKKWSSILEAKRSGNWVALARVRRSARSLHHWESLRDCDLYLAAAKRDEALLLQVYVGTPFASYRHRLFVEWGAPVEVPSQYLWGKQSQVLDLRDGTFKGRPYLRPGGLSHRLLLILSADFYRPQQVGGVFSELYPGEYFNPQTSVAKVYEVVRRLRRELAHGRVPLSVRGSTEGYYLELGVGFGLCLSRREDRVPLEDRRLRLLRERVEDGDFTNREAAKILRLPPRSTSRLLRGACAEGVIERRGAGVATTYRFVA